MPWIKIDQLMEGQFVRLKTDITMSSFKKEMAVNNASFSLSYGDLHDYRRNDASIKSNSVGKIMSPFSLTDGCYLVRFENVTRHTNNELKPAYFFDGAGSLVRMQKKELLENAEVWVD